MRQTSPREYERLTLLRYQDGAVARHYHSEYAGPWTLTTLPARVVAMRERRIIDQAMSNGFDHAAPPVRKVLDLPCGAGKLAVVFARHPFSVIAADISLTGIAQNREGWPVSVFWTLEEQRLRRCGNLNIGIHFKKVSELRDDFIDLADSIIALARIGI